MRAYRAFPLDHEAHIAKVLHEIEAATDAEAVEEARQFVNGLDIELWHNARLVTRLRHK